MNEHLISDLGRYVDDRIVMMAETPGHIELNIVRAEVALSVLIPRHVPEWWVEVNDSASGRKIADWCDYAGYDATAGQALSERMRTDVVRFIENVLARPLRVGESMLEWHVGREWSQAVPLETDAERGPASYVRDIRA